MRASRNPTEVMSADYVSDDQKKSVRTTKVDGLAQAVQRANKGERKANEMACIRFQFDRVM